MDCVRKVEDAKRPPPPKPAPTPLPHQQPQTSFRPREYPALRIIIVVLYVLAGLILTQFFLAELLVFGGTLAGIAGSHDSETEAGIMFPFLVFQAVLIISHATAITIVVGCAECVRVFVDIQHNTQEAAFYSKATGAGL